MFFRPPAEAKTSLISPAIVDGLRDNERQKLIRVAIWLRHYVFIAHFSCCRAPDSLDK